MKRVIALGLMALAGLSAAACGSAPGPEASKSKSWMPSTLAKSVQETYTDGKGSLHQTSCIHQEGAVWECMGFFRATAAGIRQRYHEPSLSDSDAQKLSDSEAQNINLRVTVDDARQTWIAKPE